MTLIIRPATIDNQADVLKLYEQLFEPPGSPPPASAWAHSSEAFRATVERADSDILLAFDGGVLVGLASVYADINSIRFGQRCWLEDIVVDDDRRSEGVGRKLLNAACGWAREHGCTHLELASGAGRVDAHRFYERQGMARSFHFNIRLD